MNQLDEYQKAAYAEYVIFIKNKIKDLSEKIMADDKIDFEDKSNMINFLTKSYWKVDCVLFEFNT